MKLNVYEEYCTGCGLCKSVLETNNGFESSGFWKPIIEKKNQFYDMVCPVNKKNTSSSIWGTHLEYLLGHASDEKIRKNSSSGGILTAIALYLIENRIVDGIIHVERDCAVAYNTQVTISRTAKEIFEHSGSRYSSSSPLINITEIVNEREKYAFIGKPCDVSALKAYMEKYDTLKNIIYMFSFFCAGVPSENAQLELLRELGCLNVNECETLNYRGNGWPGYTTCYFKDGHISTMTYEKSWGQILGRDVRKMCRFCMDGIGIMADITCCDAWILTKDKKPDFSEADGRNAILVRSKQGKEILDAMREDKLIDCESADIDELKYMQTYQYERRATMIDRILAMVIMRKDIPNYSFKEMIKLSNNVSIRKHLHIFKGTLQRIKSGKI